MALTDEQKADVLRRLSIEVLGGGDMAVVDELVREDFVDHAVPPGAPQGREGFKAGVQMLRAGLPDIAPRPVQVFADGDKVMYQWEGTGTHNGDFSGIPPTGRPVRFAGISIAVLDGDGKLVERWAQINLLDMLQQLGVVPGDPPQWQLGATMPEVANGRSTSPEENKEIFRRHIEEIWNRGNLAAADELLHPRAVMPFTPEVPPGPAGCQAMAGMLRAAFSDFTVSVDDIVAADDLVAARTTISGTHTGDLFGIPPTGKPVRFEEMTVVKIADGRILARWSQSDQMTMMQQLGLGPGGPPPG
jgi:predicted ester cyclase